MSRTNTSQNSNLDDRLADFTDDMLEGRMKQTASTADEDLLLLEDTVLRLSKTYPPVSLDEARVKQMQVRLKNRIRRETQETEQPFWKKWFARPQVRALIGVVSVLLLFVIASPYLTAAGSSTTAAALTPTLGTFIALGLTIMLVLILWIKRRK
ncbi:MAG: hypothetical protein Q8L87_08015 [Anaerolineales bacterium]|nr:hypothetical protein [Anaerolineales bacterium]